MTDQLDRLKAALADRYKVEGQLGVGGMATVYLAEDLKHKRKVAVKVLHPDLAVALGAERFLREIEIEARLTHPHILPLHDSGVADEFLYYVMPFVEGESLRDRLNREGQLPLDDALQIGREVADALAYAHSHDVVHRDIKPENILLEEGHAVVADFGVARAISAVDDEQLTKTGIAVGTPAYMSPEQASGEHRLDGRSDVYALGCVLYEMLTGQPPFTGATAQAIMARKVMEPTPSPRVVRDSIPPAVEQAVMRALAKTPADRFATAEQFAQSLRPTASIHPKPPLVRRAAVWYGVVGAIALLVLFVATQQPARTAVTTDRSIAVLPFKNLSEGAESDYFSDGITEDILTQLSQVRDLRVMPLLATRQYKNTDKGPKEIGLELNTATLLTGSVRRAGDRLRVTCQLVDTETGAQIWAQTYNREIQDVFSIQSDVAQQIARALEATLLPVEIARIERQPTANPTAYDYYLRGRDYYYRYKRQDNERAIEFFQRALELDSTYALAWAGLGDAYAQRPVRYKFPFSWVDSALAVAEKAIALDSGSAEAYKALGLAYVYKGQYRKGVEAYRQAVARNPNYFSAAANAGAIYTYLGEFTEALRWLKYSAALNPTHTNTYGNIGEVYRLLGDTTRAVQWYTALEEDANGLARVYLAQGRDQEALDQIEKILSDDPTSSRALELAGDIAHLAAAFTKAKQYFEQSIANHDAIETDPYIVSPIGLGHILWTEGRFDEARELLDRSRDIRAERIAQGNEEMFGRHELAAIYAIQGNKAEAYRWLRDAIDAGWRDYRLAVRDPWFENLHGDEEFQRLMKDVEAMVDEMRRRVEEAAVERARR